MVFHLIGEQQKPWKFTKKMSSSDYRSSVKVMTFPQKFEKTTIIQRKMTSFSLFLSLHLATSRCRAKIFKLLCPQLKKTILFFFWKSRFSSSFARFFAGKLDRLLIDFYQWQYIYLACSWCNWCAPFNVNKIKDSLKNLTDLILRHFQVFFIHCDDTLNYTVG